ncbi:TonB-dependent receptor; Outer membrane receptor for ferrienterochelin and colicins, partial [hydrothermal vent metagenome]
MKTSVYKNISKYPRFLCAGFALLALQGFAANPAFADNEQPATDPVDRIVIIGNKARIDDVPGSATLLDLETLQKQSYGDINRILRAVPGVNLQEEDGFGLRPNIGLRGTGLDRSSKITLMEDGVLIAPAAYAAPAAYYFPSSGRMAGIEVVKGASGIKYGPRTQGGSINLISTPIPKTASAFGTFKIGDFGSRSAHVWAGGPIAEPNNGVKISGMLEGFVDRSTGFKQLANGGDTGFLIQDMVGKLRFESADGARISQSLDLKVQLSDERANVSYLGLTDADFASTPFRRYAAAQLDQINAKHSELSARYRADLGAGFDLTV